MAGIEIAPEGTRALLGDVVKLLREDEARVQEWIVQRQEIVEANATPQATTTSKAAIVKLNEQSNRYSRLAGRVDALLAGWEPEA